MGRRGVVNGEWRKKVKRERKKEKQTKNDLAP
jgi:hypothetical protein